MKTSSPTLPPLRSTPLFLGRFSTFPTANVPYRHTRCFCNDIIGNAVKNFVSIPNHRYIFSKITVKKSINHLQENVVFYKKHLVDDNKKNAIVSKPICQSLFLFQGVCFRSLNFFLFPAASCSFRKMQERNIQTKITKNAEPLHFANNCLQESAIFYKEAA